MDIVVNCIGIFLLVEMGILNDKVVMIYWGYVDKFKVCYLMVNV